MTKNKVSSNKFVDIDLSIIVVSYNTRDMTLECLRSIKAQTQDIEYEVIVVDNDSKDGSAEAIGCEFPTWRLIALGENIGFARGNNLAASEAIGRRILLLNPDTVVLDGAIDSLFAFADQTPSCRVWGGRTLRGDGSLDPTSCWRRMTLWSLVCFALGLSYLAPNSSILNPESYGSWQRDTVREVDIVTGCFLMIDRELWEELGGFDPAFFMYGEEADLCYRARLAGAKPILTPSATIVHYGAASETVPLEKVIKLLKGKTTVLYRQSSPVGRGLGRALFLAGSVTRWWTYYLVARLSKQPRLDRKAEHWRTVWKRRREWINGYTPDETRFWWAPGTNSGRHTR